jgi:dihydroorotase
MVKSGLMSVADLWQRMSIAPAKLARYENHGELIVGRTANFVLVNLNKSWKVDAGALKSKSKNTPYDGMELPAVVEKTFHNGVLVYDRDNEGREGA